jgi:hypothetical protein
MPSTGMLHRVALVIIYVWEERSASSVRRLLVTANVGPSSTIFAALMLEALCSSEMSIFTRATRLTSHKTAIFKVMYVCVMCACD